MRVSPMIGFWTSVLVRRRGASLVAELIKNPPVMQETLVRLLAGEGIDYPLQYSWASLVAQLIKNPPSIPETCV